MSKLGTTRPTTIINVVTNLELLGEHQSAVEELNKLNRTQSSADRMNSPYSKEARAKAKRVQELETEMDESTVCIKLKALKRAEYAEVIAKHPPREDNDVDNALGFNTDTFGDDAIALSIVGAWKKTTGEKIDFTGDDWKEESAEFTDGQYSDFTNAVLNLNRSSTTVPFSPIASGVNRS
ncbi:hypothetical protein KTJ89_11260 [Brevibacterium sediminis]|uniref:hypothetical protein n=1 Tax=Brevibacterium sediminis TaxID=1857024 RepID=UPI0021751907|nr:hypothetical protein [Brevibacterium sediminis]MCS4593559.1 hypothetical protein [Brevibacterium sediminis]